MQHSNSSNISKNTNNYNSYNYYSKGWIIVINYLPLSVFFSKRDVDCSCAHISHIPLKTVPIIIVLSCRHVTQTLYMFTGQDVTTIMIVSIIWWCGQPSEQWLSGAAHPPRGRKSALQLNKPYQQYEPEKWANSTCTHVQNDKQKSYIQEDMQQKKIRTTA